MARIQSFISSAVTRATDAADAVADKIGGSEATQEASETDGESTVDEDRWENGTDGIFEKFQEGLTQAQTTAGELRDAAVGRAASKVSDGLTRAGEARDAVVGEAVSEVSEGLARVAEWFEPGEQALDALRDARQEVEVRVQEEVERLDPEAVGEALQLAASGAEDLAGQILEKVDEPDFSIRTRGASAHNTVLNAVGNVCADLVIENRDAVMASGEAIQQMSTALDDLPLIGADPSFIEKRFMDTLFPGSHLAPTMARWGISAMGSAVEQSVEVAEHFKDSPGLPTKGNFPSWIDRLQPGEKHVVEGQFLVNIATGVGAKAQASRGITLDRSAEDPNQVVLTMTEGAKISGGVGAEAQDQGASAMAGAGTATELVFTFDTSRPEDLDMLGDLVLANQTGLPSEDAIRIADEYMTSAKLAGDLSVATKFNIGIKLRGGAGGAAIYEMNRRAEGTVHRLAASHHLDWSAGASLIDRVPQSAIDGLGASAPHDEAEMAGQILAALSGGHVGTTVGVKGSLTAGVEVVDNRLERIFIEAKLDGQFLGRQGQIDAEFVIHDPIALADAIDITTDELIAQLEEGNIDLPALFQGAEERGLDPSEFMGLKATASREVVDGLDVSVLGATFKSLNSRTDKVELLDLGRPIDRSPAPREEPLDSKDLLYDRPWPG